MSVPTIILGKKKVLLHKTARESVPTPDLFPRDLPPPPTPAVIPRVAIDRDPKFISKTGKSRSYWVANNLCYYNAFYNTYFLKNDATHRVRAGELFYKGRQQTDGEVHWRVSQFNLDLSDAHFWVETNDGLVIDWIVRLVGKKERDIVQKVWTRDEVTAMGVEHRYYDHEDEVLRRAFDLYGDTCDEEREEGVQI
jgi:hypothetical protein